MKQATATCPLCKKDVPTFRTSNKQYFLSFHRNDKKDDLGRFYQCKGSYMLVVPVAPVQKRIPKGD